MPPHINDLPNDVLGHILALTGIDVGFPTALVCARWHQVAFSDAAAHLWQSLNLELSSQLLASPQLLASTRTLVQRTGAFAQRATLWARRHPTPLNDHSLPAALPEVESAAGTVLAEVTEQLSPASLRQLELWLLPLPAVAVLGLGHFSRLEALCLGHRHLPPSATAAALRHLTALTSLELMADSLGASVMASVTRLSRLRSLGLRSRQLLPDLDRLSALASLTRLTLENGPLRGAHTDSLLRLPAAAAFPGLARLDAVALAFQVQDEIIQVLGLSVSASGMYQGQPYKPAISLACGDGRASLKLGLIIPAAGSLQALLTGVLPPAAHLHRLELNGCTLSAQSSSGCGQHLASVAELSLSDSLEQDATMTECLAALVRHMPQLRRLELLGLGSAAYSEFADLDVEQDLLAAGLPAELAPLAQLEQLTVTGLWLATLPDGPNLDSLTHLNLQDNRLQRLPRVLARATRLQHLSLASNSSLLLDSAAARLLARLPALQRLELPMQTPDRLVQQLAEFAQAQNLQITLG